eukprot:g35763.t1
MLSFVTYREQVLYKTVSEPLLGLPDVEEATSGAADTVDHIDGCAGEPLSNVEGLFCALNGVLGPEPAHQPHLHRCLHLTNQSQSHRIAGHTSPRGPPMPGPVLDSHSHRNHDPRALGLPPPGAAATALPIPRSLCSGPTATRCCCHRLANTQESLLRAYCYQELLPPPCQYPGVSALGLPPPGNPGSAAKPGHCLAISPAPAPLLHDVTFSAAANMKKTKKRKRKKTKR